MFDSFEELQAFVTARGWQQSESKGAFVFGQEEKKEELHFVRNSVLICQSLGYARELEKIV